MATSPTTMTVTNDYLADEIEKAGKRLIDLAMSLRRGFDVTVDYVKPPATRPDAGERWLSEPDSEEGWS